LLPYLKNAGEEDIGEIGIDDLELLGRVVGVLAQELPHNSGQGRHSQLCKELNVM